MPLKGGQNGEVLRFDQLSSDRRCHSARYSRNEDKAREYIKTYVMSDHMAESLQAPVLDQLQMEEVVDNKGVLIVGNYGTGKSHLLSVLSSIAVDAENVRYLQNKKFAELVKPIAGRFEVLRIEIDGVVMPLYYRAV